MGGGEGGCNGDQGTRSYTQVVDPVGWGRRGFGWLERQDWPLKAAEQFSDYLVPL